jgi:hypothetical protein
VFLTLIFRLAHFAPHFAPNFPPFFAAIAIIYPTKGLTENLIRAFSFKSKSAIFADPLSHYP